MQIVCPLARPPTTFPGDALPSAGRKVRCARCKETWLARRRLEPVYAADNDWPVPDSVYSAGAEPIPDEALPEAAKHRPYRQPAAGGRDARGRAR